MHEYLVVWQIELYADSPREAAQEARRIQMDPESLATIFTVTRTNAVATIDTYDGFDEDE